MTTTLQKYTKENESKICSSQTEVSLDNSDIIILNENEDGTADKSDEDLALEKVDENQENNDSPTENWNKSAISDLRERELKGFPFLSSIFRVLISAIKLFLNEMNSDINNGIEICLGILGISQDRISKKMIKQLFLLIIFIIAYVQSSKKGAIYQNFEVHRFFPRHSLVTDFFEGELSMLRNEIHSSDITVVMYYAPWDRQSQNFVSHFMKASQYHHEEVTFAAINCWLPKSECKMQYKLQFYPLVVLHVKDSFLEESFTVPYNGPLLAHHVIRFISRALHPIKYIANQADLLSLQLQSQVIVLGYYNHQHLKKEFLSFYFAALSRLQFEYMSDVRYAVITNSALAKKFGFIAVPSIHLMLWDNTLIFPPGMKMNMRNITNFVDTNMYEATHWLHISGRKSLSFNKVYQHGPFLIIFAPDNPHHSSSEPFQLLRSVALEYFNCHSKPFLTWLADHFHLKSRADRRESDKICQKYLKSQLQSNIIYDLEYEERRNKDSGTCQLDEESNVYKLGSSNYRSYFSWNSIWGSFMESDPLTFGNHCHKYSSNYFCKNKNESENESIPNFNWRKMEPEDHNKHRGPKEDEKILQMIENHAENQCKSLYMGSALVPTPSVIELGENTNITGLSCKTNRTLKFVVIDSLLHGDFAQQLGLDLRKLSQKQLGALIIDPVMEERYILDGALSRESMSNFIYNFTYNLLDRGKIFTEEVKTKDCSSDEVCVMELNGENYLKVVNKPKQAFVVMHYSHHCGGCSAVSSVLLTCQHIASNVSNLTFARIDVSKNTLPWHLTFDSVPTIVFHPHDRKQETRVLNPKLSINVKNLMRFIISGLRPAERNSLALKLCNADCRKEVSSRGLLLKVKTHHQIDIVSSKIKRFINLLIQLKAQLIVNPHDDDSRSKYNLFSEVKAKLNEKLTSLKNKVYHLNRLIKYDLIVPSEY